MALQTVEISLRIPSLRVRVEGKDAPETIVNSDIRFCKCIELEPIPKAGAVLQMTVGDGGAFECQVVGSNFHEGKNMFVIACTYAKRSITQTEYQALMNASDWKVRPLL